MTRPERDDIMKTNTTPHLRMRDLQPLGVQDIKDQAQRLRKLLKGSVDLKHTQSLEMAAKMQGFESWGQARAYLETLSLAGATNPAPKLSRRRLAGGSSPLGLDLLNGSHAALIMTCDIDGDMLVDTFEWAQGEIWQKPGCLYLRRPDRPEHTDYAQQPARLVSELARRMGQPIPEAQEFSYDAVLDHFSQAVVPCERQGGILVLSLPWRPGDNRLFRALSEMAHQNIYVMVRIGEWDLGKAAKGEVEALLNACDLWVLASQATLPVLTDCAGGKLRNDDDDLMAFTATEVRRLFASPDYKGDLAEVSVPDEVHDIRVALRMIDLMD